MLLLLSDKFIIKWLLSIIINKLALVIEYISKFVVDIKSSKFLLLHILFLSLKKSYGVLITYLK